MSKKSAMKNRYAAVTKKMLTNLKSYNLSFWFLLVVFAINKSARNSPSLSLEFLIWQHFKNIKIPTFVMAILFLEHFGAMGVHIIPKRWVAVQSTAGQAATGSLGLHLPVENKVGCWPLSTTAGAWSHPHPMAPYECANSYIHHGWYVGCSIWTAEVKIGMCYQDPGVQLF